MYKERLRKRIINILSNVLSPRVLHVVFSVKMEDYNSCVMKELKRRNCPLHLTLIASYISVEKYDKLLRTFCKEFPATMIKLNNEKKSIKAQKRTVYAMISRIQEILDKLNSAVSDLDALYEKELNFKLEKENDLSDLQAVCSSAENRKKILNECKAEYLNPKNCLESIAASTGFTSGRSLVEFYLNVEALNEQFVSLKSQRVQEIKGNSDSQQLWHYSHDITNHQKSVVNLQSEIQNFKTQSAKLSLILSHSENIHRQKHLNWLQTRKWINQVHKKISHYKEVYSQPDNILGQIYEIEEFIIAARKVVKML